MSKLTGLEVFEVLYPMRPGVEYQQYRGLIWSMEPASSMTMVVISPMQSAWRVCCLNLKESYWKCLPGIVSPFDVQRFVAETGGLSTSRVDTLWSAAEWEVEQFPRRLLLAGCDEIHRWRNGQRADAGHVYFIGDPARGMIKIGFTRGHVSHRMKQLQTSAASDLVLLGTEVGGLGRERELHDRFAHLRVHGEWFHADQELTAYIKERAA